MQAAAMTWNGNFSEAERWLARAWRAGDGNHESAVKVLLHLTTGMLHAGIGALHRAAVEFRAAEEMQSILAREHVLAPQVTAWRIAAEARLGLIGQARASLDTLRPSFAQTGEIANARAVVHLVEGDAAAALNALSVCLEDVTHGVRQFTLVESHLLAAQAHVKADDRKAAVNAVEYALSLAEADRLILPFAMASAVELLELLPRHQTAHAALLADIVDLLSGAPDSQPRQYSVQDELTPSELKVLRYLPTNLTRGDIAGELYLSINTVNTHFRNIYTKLGARDRSSAVERARGLRLLSTGVARSPAFD
jgi:LuxR family maltose regulon positive regulatory protein